MSGNHRWINEELPGVLTRGTIEETIPGACVIAIFKDQNYIAILPCP